MASIETKKVKTPRSFSEVKSLPHRDLLTICIQNNIEAKGIGRDALDILICEALGISTTGTVTSKYHNIKPKVESHCLDKVELHEYESFTPTLVNSLTNWSIDANLLPEIDIGQVKKYLLSSGNEEFFKGNLKNYKLTRSYQHMKSKHIHSVKLYVSKTFCVVKAQCLPSQSGDNKRVKWLYAILDKATGEPYGGFCVCTVGRTQVCSHIGALLFLLCEVVANGDSSLPADHNYLSHSSCTDMLCQWTDPKAATVTPKTMNAVSLSKTNERIKPTTTSYVPKVAPDLTPAENYNRVLKLLYDVRIANESAAMPPIVKIVDVGKFRTKPLPPPPIQTTLPSICQDFDIPFSHEVTIETHPLAIIDFPHLSFSSKSDLGFEVERNRFSMSIMYTHQEMLMIEKLTRSQSESAEWFHQRKGAVTSSRAIKIVNFYKNESKNPSSILKDLLQHDPLQAAVWKKVPSLSWGIKNEERALHAYLKDYRSSHTSVQVSRTGLYIHPKHPYIRASPDAIISCECHGKILVEVKCPYVHRNSAIHDMISQGKVEYISEKGALKVGHSRGYYEQIMVQEAVTGIHNTVLVIWTKRGYTAIDVPFAKDNWERTILPSASQFFHEHIIPAILISQSSSESHTTVSLATMDSSVDECCPQLDVNPSSSQHSQSVCPEEVNGADLDSSIMPEESDDEVEDENWILGCKDYCRDDKAPKYSTIGGQLIACDANIVCLANTWFHLFCEGHRRVPKSTNKKYACKKCRDEMPNKENVRSGFYE